MFYEGTGKGIFKGIFSPLSPPVFPLRVPWLHILPPAIPGAAVFSPMPSNSHEKPILQSTGSLSLKPGEFT